AVRGQGIAAQGTAQPAVGQPARDRGPVAAQGDPGVERDGPPVAAREAGDAREPTAAADRGVGPGCQLVHPGVEPARATWASRGPVGKLLVDDIAATLCKNFLPPT